MHLEDWIWEGSPYHKTHVPHPIQASAGPIPALSLISPILEKAAQYKAKRLTEFNAVSHEMTRGGLCRLAAVPFGIVFSSAFFYNACSQAFDVKIVSRQLFFLPFDG